MGVRGYESKVSGGRGLGEQCKWVSGSKVSGGGEAK